eukprot:scaffold65042_cov58-Phaeocystis_antarctica.AAC.2
MAPHRPPGCRPFRPTVAGRDPLSGAKSKSIFALCVMKSFRLMWLQGILPTGVKVVRVKPRFIR